MIADVGDGVVVDRGVGAVEVAITDGAEQRPDLDAVLGGVAVWAPMTVLSWMLAVSVDPLTKMPSFWKPLTVEFWISTV